MSTTKKSAKKKSAPKTAGKQKIGPKQKPQHKQKSKPAAKAPAKKLALKVKPALKKPEPKKAEIKKVEVKKLPPVKPATATALAPLIAKKPAPAPKPEPKVSKNSGLEGEDAKADEEKAEGPIIDTAAEAIKKMIKKGKERGYVTIDEINAALPQDKINSDLIEDTMAMLSEMGISVTEGDDDEAPKEKKEGEEGEEEKEAGNVNEELGRTDDPVRLYLREMGTVELLSREGEIAIAKRIEAGREMMIGGICESPLTIQAILGWHDALNDGKMLLRDIIDLEATYGGAPDHEADMLGEGEGAGPRLPKRKKNPKPKKAKAVRKRRRTGKPVAVDARGKAQAPGDGNLWPDRRDLQPPL